MLLAKRILRKRRLLEPAAQTQQQELMPTKRRKNNKKSSSNLKGEFRPPLACEFSFCSENRHVQRPQCTRVEHHQLHWFCNVVDPWQENSREHLTEPRIRWIVNPGRELHRNFSGWVACVIESKVSPTGHCEPVLSFEPSTPIRPAILKVLFYSRAAISAENSSATWTALAPLARKFVWQRSRRSTACPGMMTQTRLWCSCLCKVDALHLLILLALSQKVQKSVDFGLKST